MPIEALFLNGVYSSILDDIWNVQRAEPERTLFIQPYRAYAIKRIRVDPPTAADPVCLYLSTTDDLATVSYTAKIVGWEDKRLMSRERIAEVCAIIKECQPHENEDGLYFRLEDGRVPVNLLHIQSLAKLSADAKFSVAELIKMSDRKPLSTNRQTSGNWSYVYRRGQPGSA